MGASSRPTAVTSCDAALVSSERSIAWYEVTLSGIAISRVPKKMISGEGSAAAHALAVTGIRQPASPPSMKVMPPASRIARKFVMKSVKGAGGRSQAPWLRYRQRTGR